MSFSEDMMADMAAQREKLDSYGKELTSFFPHVSFVIPATGVRTNRYHQLILSLLREFIKTTDPRNKKQAEFFSFRSFSLNTESGIGLVWFNGIFIDHCKMYVCDGTTDSAKYNPNHQYKPWRGLIFRDHIEPNPERTTAKVFTIADTLENFLTSKGVKFKRINLAKERSK